MCISNIRTFLFGSKLECEMVIKCLLLFNYLYVDSREVKTEEMKEVKPGTFTEIECIVDFGEPVYLLIAAIAEKYGGELDGIEDSKELYINKQEIIKSLFTSSKVGNEA